VHDQLILDAGTRDQWVPGVCQWTAGEELEEEERKVEHDIQYKETVDDPETDGTSVQGAVVRHEDAPDLHDERDFQGNDDEGVDSDRYMEELDCISVSDTARRKPLKGGGLHVHALWLSEQ
jgi:hypothetical protein